MKATSVVVLTVLLASCAKRATTPTGDLLEPPPGAGVLAIEMHDTWRITRVELVEEFVPEPKSIPPHTSRGLIRPEVDNLITIDERGFVTGAGRRLLREDCESSGNIVREYFNHASGTVALYNMACSSPPDPRIADGGSLHLRMAVGATAPNSMLGLIDFNLSGFTAASTPLSGTYRVELEREL